MKLFTLAEANEIIPDIRPKLQRLMHVYARVGKLRECARAAAAASDAGGGMTAGPAYVTMLFQIGAIVDELTEIGIQIKDHSRGLIDFPSFRDGRIVLLCWQLGEPEKIEWWHETEEGFAGRQRI
jgi:hypothetical protein